MNFWVETASRSFIIPTFRPGHLQDNDSKNDSQLYECYRIRDKAVFHLRYPMSRHYCIKKYFDMSFLNLFNKVHFLLHLHYMDGTNEAVRHRQRQ